MSEKRFFCQGKNIHFIGAGGIGVSALALFAKQQGAIVSCCEKQPNEMVDYLQKKGISVAVGHSQEHLAGCDLVVYSSAIPADNSELLAAGHQKIEFMRRGTFLARMLEGQRVIGVCGTHGKTTTTWILGQLLEQAGLAPTIILGGIGCGEESNFKSGDSDLVVVELDESDGSFLEPAVDMAVITTVEADHLDYYGDSGSVKDAFVKFVNLLKPAGCLVACTDDFGAAQVYAASLTEKINVGLQEPAFLLPTCVSHNNFTQSFRLRHEQEDLGLTSLSLPGEHNLQNALCALAAAFKLGVSWSVLEKLLPACTAVKRRFEIVGRKNNIIVVDDYAHHPGEIAAVLKTARRCHQGRVIAVFQPHLYSRTKFFLQEFALELAKADMVVILDIYAAREKPIVGVTSSLVKDAVLGHNSKVSGPFAWEKAASEISKIVVSGDLVLFLGAGNIGNCAYELLEQLP